LSTTDRNCWPTWHKFQPRGERVHHTQFTYTVHTFSWPLLSFVAESSASGPQSGKAPYHSLPLIYISAYHWDECIIYPTRGPTRQSPSRTLELLLAHLSSLALHPIPSPKFSSPHFLLSSTGGWGGEGGGSSRRKQILSEDPLGMVTLRSVPHIACFGPRR
jgi:hypothetical protein